ncbi:MAG: HisA/HisF-related TIM barrel protein [Caulobacteraceae bacterium]
MRDPELVKTAAKQWPEQIAVSVDVRKGQVAVQGWLEDSGLDALTVAKRFEDAGVSALIVTDIDRDGALAGFNVEVFGGMADAVHIPVNRRRWPGQRRRYRTPARPARHADRRRRAGPRALRRRDPGGAKLWLRRPDA